jgi:hypothetical protein
MMDRSTIAHSHLTQGLTPKPQKPRTWSRQECNVFVESLVHLL